MATTITAVDLSVSITENYSLNNIQYGNTSTKSFGDNSKVEQRIMEIPTKGGGEGTTWTGILDLETADSAGHIIKADFKYFRVTNLDDTENFNLRLYNGVDYLILSILPSASFVLMDASVDATTTDIGVTFADITKIQGQSDSASAGVEIEFVAVTV